MLRWPKPIQRSLKQRHQSLMMPLTVELALSCVPSASKIKLKFDGRLALIGMSAFVDRHVLG